MPNTIPHPKHGVLANEYIEKQNISPGMIMKQKTRTTTKTTTIFFPIVIP